ncbi:hypothetical protein ABMA27_008895 [Loxostege sticticalis]|uniref:Roadblock/LAMTOR2 domain-containing protein n=1 Tax=Loxostege sticticalis TaxID=481309 RepID=A0ABR3H968_LOXSC
MKIITNLIKDYKDQWLINTTVVINEANPIIDRIMDDDSVAGVIMTNKEGAPILTNISTTRATNYGLKLNRFGAMTQIYIKELDPFDEVLAVRFHTKKVEVMLAPHPEFNIIVIQQPRPNAKKHTNKENMLHPRTGCECLMRVRYGQ